MLVREIMSTKPDYLAPTTILKKAADDMKKFDFGFVPVLDHGNLVGVLTDRDIAIRAVSAGKDPNTTYLKDIMSTHVVSCHDTDDIKKAAELMEEKQIRRLVVLDKSGKLAGIISLGDIATKCHDFAWCGHLIESVSEKVH